MSFFHNLTTNIKVINLKHLKSLIDIAHYGNDDPHCMSWQLLCQCLSPHVWLRGCFSNWIQNKKFVVLAVYILLLSCLSQTKHFQILASLVNHTLLSMVSLETFQSGCFHECIYAPAETTKFSFNQPRSVCSTRERLRSQHKRKHYASCLNPWQYQV